MSVKLIPTAQVAACVRVQGREREDAEHIEQMATTLRAGEKLPPIDVFELDGKRIIADGNHRVAAYVAAGVDLVRAHVHEGGRLAALKHAVKVNGEQKAMPLRLTERKNYARQLLEEDPTQSSREVGRACGLHHTTVESLRPTTGYSSQSTTRRGADGRSTNTTGQKEAGRRKAVEAVAAKLAHAADRATLDAAYAELARLAREGRAEGKELESLEAVYRKRVADLDAATPAEPEPDEEFDSTTPVEPEVFEATTEPARQDHSDAEARPRDFGELDEGIAAERLIDACDACAAQIATLLSERPLLSYRSTDYREGARGALLRLIKALNEHAKDHRPTLGVIQGGR